MSTIHVLPLPQTAPISDLRNRQDEILTMTENGPVVLMSRSKPAAVLLSPAYWDAIARTLEAYQRQSEANKPSTAMMSVPDEYGASEEIDALAAIAALAQPLGPADLARNFDTYTKRVLQNEPEA
ncbi:MAG TPA: type II toxin-antitoxin system Phd/YefM family antitoxin [Caldilineaceae bacterium]|nr:type II toxin-antitoxin system Phd/YefM family antitoxin [Caldilineaceae bacterium]